MHMCCQPRAEPLELHELRRRRGLDERRYALRRHSLDGVPPQGVPVFDRQFSKCHANVPCSDSGEGVGPRIGARCLCEFPVREWIQEEFTNHCRQDTPY